MKRLITILLAMTIALSQTAGVSAKNEEDILNLLTDLNIMVGDGNGNYRLDDNVSRAEFTKIAVSASKSKNTVAKGAKVSPFSDVTYEHWSAPYVRAAVTAGIVEGYIDATFKPDNTVTYEEALTMLLKVLGYASEDFGYSWPYGQIGLADSLDITKNSDASQGEALTRRQVARLVYNALNTKMKDSTSKLISVFECEVIKDVTIISSHNEDSSLAENKVFTTAGTFEINDNFNSAYVGKKGDIFVRNGDELISFTPESGSGNALEKYVIYSQLPNAIIGYKNGSFTQVDITDGTTCYKDSAKTTYAAVKNSLEMGDVLYVKMNGNSVDYVSYEKGNMEGPVKVYGSDWMQNFNTDSSTTIMRGGVKTTASDIQVNDIIYYSSDLNMVLAYTDKVTGVYEKAAPTKDSPISVTVSGKEYAIESVGAFNDLSSSGRFKYGDTVTLLMGRDGKIAGVAGGEATAASSNGFVIAAGKKDFTKPDGSAYSSYYARVVSVDGNVHEYETASNMENLVCAVVRVTFRNGKANLSRSSGDSLSGTVNASRGTIGSSKMAEDIKILDTSGVYSDDIPGYCRIYPQRIDGINLRSPHVKYYSRNAAGEIDELILSDVTGDSYTYGIVVRSSNGSYTIDIDGTQNTYMTGFSSTRRGPHRFMMSGSSIKSMVGLSQYSSNIKELTRTEAVIDSQKYLLSDRVVVYRRMTDYSYMKITLDEAIEGSYKMTAYYDKAQTSGGRIRIIIAQ